MRNIEIIGMRKKRDLKICITIIVLAIIGILICLAIIFYEKKNVAKVTVANINLESEINSNNTVQNSNENKNDTLQENDFDSKSFINSIDNIYNGEEGKRVFLTFDDGPTKEVTPYILDILDKYNIKATFFVLGTNVSNNPDILKRAYESGHYIANHGYSHKYSSIYKSVDTVLEEYNKTEQIIKNALENPNYSSHLFRFPGGSHGGEYEKVKKQARKKLKEESIAYMDWSALTYDAIGVDSKEKILENLENTMNGWNNVVVLMHDSADKQITYESLEDVIKYLQGKGYAFKNIYDLI